VEIVSYHTDMREFPAFARVKSEYFVDGFPAWSAVGVTALIDPRARIEIRATVVIGSGPAIEEPLEEEESVPQAET
jgi:enamine deaminase RidA (YjgF/YER057c/UK114 family)